MVMCIFLFLLWLILNGKVTLEICLFGVVITGAVYAFCVAALGCRPQAERRFLKRLGGYVVYGAILVREIIRANLAVMRVIWSRKPDYHPAIVRVHAPLEKPVSRMLLSNSITLTPGATVITGANMGGKSVAMKTVALNVLLLQAGFLVCAKKARMPLFHSVKMLFDDLQSIQSGLSGFGSEIVQFEKALAQVEQGYSLFLLDEFARGTNPDEGALIVQAVTRYLNDVNAISLLTTHYDKVAEFARTHYQIIGLRDIDPEAIRRELAVTSEDGVAVIARHMNYGLYRVEGKSDCPRDALNICRMLSLKPEILTMIEENY